MICTLEDHDLAHIMPHARHIETMLGPLNAACLEGGLSKKPLRLAAFLAQIAHESAELRFFEEIASGAAYEGRSDLGNNQPGDGTRYKGRGPLQITGRSNARAAGIALGLPLEEKPEMMALPEVGFRTAVWFWNSRKLNELADSARDPKVFDTITRRINGGLNGKLYRDEYFKRACEVLGC